MATGSGLDGQLMYKLETTVGTPVTVTNALEFDDEGFEFDPTWIEPTGLRVGTKFKRGSRLIQSRKMISGDINLHYATRLMGALWKVAIGSSIVTPTVITGTSYKQVHQTGDLLGKSLTIQVGRPEPSTQTVKPHTIAGAKCTGWEFSVADNEVAKLSMSFDGWDEATATALATASYVTAEEFSFMQVTEFSIGNTIAGTNPLTESGGTAVTAIVKSFSLKGENALATERFGLGNSGVKKEQLENGVPTITGTLDAEYLQSEWYTPFKANTATSLVFRMEGSIISEANKNTLEFIIPEIRIKKVTPKVTGPDLVMASVEFEVYTNSTAQNPLQVTVISADSVAI